MRVVGRNGDVLLSVDLWPTGAGYRYRGNAELRGDKSGAIRQSFQLQILDPERQRLVIEWPRDVVVGRNGFVAQLLPQVRKGLRLGKLRLFNVLLELQKLQLDLQVVVLADVAGVGIGIG